MVKEIAGLGGCIRDLVPDIILGDIKISSMKNRGKQMNMISLWMYLRMS